MKTAHLALTLLASAFISACAYIPPKETVARRASPDYMTTSDNSTARAYVFGGHTVLEFDGFVAFLTVKDETGATVDYEKVGQYYRLSHRLNKFTVWVNGHSITFSAAKNVRVFSAPVTAAPAVAPVEAVKLAVLEPAMPEQDDRSVEELLALAQKQLMELRQVIEAASKNPKITGAELFEVYTRQQEIERQLNKATAIVSIRFPTAGTTFKPSPDVGKILIESAKLAERINLRGQTDSQIAGKMDAQIAHGRAVAAQKFLVENGVEAEKISIFSQADGGFIAPNGTKEGRALNRRVEIEFVNARYGQARARTFTTVAAN